MPLAQLMEEKKHREKTPGKKQWRSKGKITTTNNNNNDTKTITSTTTIETLQLDKKDVDHQQHR